MPTDAPRPEMSTSYHPSRGTRPLAVAALAVVALGVVPATTARADFGAVAQAFVLPATIVDRVDLVAAEHLDFTITLPAPAAVSSNALALPADFGAAPLRNVVNLFGRGMDVGRLRPQDELSEGRLFLQLRTKFSSRRVQLRCRVRFD